MIFRSDDLTLDVYADTITGDPSRFTGFDPDVTRRWLETHLLDVINRGKRTQAIAGLRPLHGFTYRLRNARRSRAYGADEQLYAMLTSQPHTGSTSALTFLREFFFTGSEAAVGSNSDGRIDVETQALISLTEATTDKLTDRAGPGDTNFHPPLVPGTSALLAEDTLRLLYHKDLIPRSVLVEYLKILFAFHLALYHLRCTKLLPALIAGKPEPPSTGIFLDVAGIAGTPIARLAERSAGLWYGRFPDFIRATFVIRKLDDFAQTLVRRNKIRRPADGMFAIGDLLALLGKDYEDAREQFAGARISRILDTDTDTVGDDPTEQIRQLGLDEFNTYIEMITTYRVGFHLKYLRECVDSLLLKNRPGSMIAQPRQQQRRFILDSRLLEVLLQISLLRPDATGFRTTPLRVDEFLTVLRDRYGLYIDALPPDDGFDRITITDQAALRDNTSAFIARLREIGFYSDLSDAYLTQTITPRYIVGASTGSGLP
nr:hypothetical protein [Nocardia nova]